MIQNLASFLPPTAPPKGWREEARSSVFGHSKLWGSTNRVGPLFSESILLLFILLFMLLFLLLFLLLLLLLVMLLFLLFPMLLLLLLLLFIFTLSS